MESPNGKCTQKRCRCIMYAWAPAGGRGKSRRLPPLENQEKIFPLYRGPFCSFFSHGAFLLRFLLMGGTFSLCKGPLHHVGVFLLHFSPFFGLAPPPHPYEISASAHGCMLTCSMLMCSTQRCSLHVHC